MENPMDDKIDGEQANGMENLDMPPPPTTTQESEQTTENNNVQLPALSNDFGHQSTGNICRAEIPDSEDVSEPSGDDVYVQACAVPTPKGSKEGRMENSIASIGIESPEQETLSELDRTASSRPVEDLNQGDGSISLPNTNTRAPTEWDQAKSAMSTKIPVSIIGAPVIGLADGQQPLNVVPTAAEVPEVAPPTIPVGSSASEGEKPANEAPFGDDRTREDDKDTEMAEVPASNPDLSTTSTSSEEAILQEKPQSKILNPADDQDIQITDASAEEDNIEDSINSSPFLQHPDVPEHASAILTKIPPASEPTTEADTSSILPASSKGKPTVSIEIQPSSPSIQDSINSSRLSCPEKVAALVALNSIMEDVPEIDKLPANIPSSPPKIEESQASTSRKSTPTVSFSAPEGSQSKDILMAELKAMKIASIQARNAALEEEIATKRAKLEEITEDLEKPAEETVKRHIKLLHDYNDIRDVGQGLVGMIADNRGVRIGELYEEFGVGLKD